MNDNGSKEIISFLEGSDKKNPISDVILQDISFKNSLNEDDIPNAEGIDDNDEMISVSMGEYGITSANHTNPILKTVGVGPCVAVALYAPDSRVAGLIHLPAGKIESTGKDLRVLIDAIQRNGVKKDELSKVIAYIVGGYGKDELPSIAANTLHDLGIDIIQANVRTSIQGYAMAIDGRTGKVSNLRNINNITAAVLSSLKTLTRPYETARATSDERSLK